MQSVITANPILRKAWSHQLQERIDSIARVKYKNLAPQAAQQERK